MPAFAPASRSTALTTLLLRPQSARCTVHCLSLRRQAGRRAGVMAPMALSKQDELKQQAAWRAVEYVKSGMKLGLGTGSTAAFAVDRIGDLLKKGELTDIVAVPTSIATREQAESASDTLSRKIVNNWGTTEGLLQPESCFGLLTSTLTVQMPACRRGHPSRHPERAALARSGH